MKIPFKPRLPGFEWRTVDVCHSTGEGHDPFHNPLFEPELLDPERFPEREFELMEDEIAAYSQSPDQPLAGNGGLVDAGLDCEWQYDPQTGRNRVLSYQAHLICPRGVMRVIVYPQSFGLKDRLDFNVFLGHIIQAAMREGLIDAWPKVLFVYAHFLRADITHFGSFWKNQSRSLDGLRGTVASIQGDYVADIIPEDRRRFTPSPLVLRDDQRHPRRVFVRFVDTLLLTPNKMGLDAVGELIGVPKLELPEGYDKSDMERLLKEQPEFFEEYALRDAEITVLYGLRMRQFARGLGLAQMPVTIGSMAAQWFIQRTGAEYAE